MTSERDSTELAEALDTELATEVEGQTTVLADAPVSTDAASAWSEGDEPDDISTEVIPRHRWRLAAGLAAGIIGVCGVVAAGVGFGGWGWEHGQQPVPVAAAPKAAPVQAKPPMLNGLYKLQDLPNVTYRNSTAAEWGTPQPSMSQFIVFTTACEHASCRLTSTYVDESGKPLPDAQRVYSWSDGSWNSTPNYYRSGPAWGSSVVTWRPQPDGTLTGGTNDAALSPGSLAPTGASAFVPTTATPIS